MNSFCSFTIIVLTSFSLVFSASSNLKLTYADFNKVVLEYSGDVPEIEKVTTNEGNFVTLHMDNTYPSREIGWAQLPVVRTFVELLWNSNVSLQCEVLELEDVPVDEFVFPLLPPVPKIPSAKPNWVFDEKYYSSSIPHFTSDAEIIETFVARDHYLAHLEFHPVNYTPAEGKLTVIKKARITMTTTSGDMRLTQQQKEQHRSPFYDATISPYIINDSFWQNLWVVPVQIELVVIANASDTTSIRDFLKWKFRKGYEVTLKTTNEIGSTASAIKTFIQNKYNTDDVDFLFLIGDTDKIPYWTGVSSGGNSTPTDNDYSELAGGDYVSDCFQGRFSLSSTTQLSHYVNRVKTYEHFGFGTGTSWTLGACLPATDDASYHGLCEATQRYIAQTWLGPRGYTRIDTIWAYYGGTGTQVLNSVNAGIMLLDYSGHGEETGWAGPVVTSSQLSALTNTGKYPFVSSHACLTGRLTVATCFMEAWIGQIDKGAIAAMGASNYSYWYHDDVKSRRMYDSVFVHSVMFTGGMRQTGLLAVKASYPSDANYYFDIYHIFGDPSISLWWGVPQNLAVNHPATISPGSGNVSITVTSGGSPVNEALVCITDDDDFQSAAYTNTSGQVTLSYSGVAVNETVYVTVTAYNKIPYEGTIIAASSTPILVYNSHSIQDNGGYGSSGDGDAVADGGETIALWVTITNAGTQTANGVNGTLSTSYPGVTITDNTSSYGTVNAGANKTPTDPFVVNLPNIPDSTSIPFSLTLRDIYDTTWNASFNVLVRAPKLRVNTRIYSELGDGDGFYEPGESLSLVVQVGNIGGDVSRNVTGTISTSDPYVTLYVNSANFGNINPSASGTGTPNFKVRVSPTCPMPHQVKIVFNGVDNRNYSCTDTSYFMVGTGGLYDGAEGGMAYWNAESPWQITQFRWHNGGNSFYFGQTTTNRFVYPANSNASMTVQNPVVLPANPTLTFWHFYSVEYGYDSCFVEVSTNGTSWQRVSAYTGESREWKFARFNLSSYGSAGSNLWLRFRVKSDAYVNMHGWFVDDIEIAPSRTAYLGGGDVFPWAGRNDGNYDFQVTYASPSSVSPDWVKVYIDGVGYDMLPISGNITTGQTYRYSSTLSAGSHQYYFLAKVGADTLRFPLSGQKFGPVVNSFSTQWNFGTSQAGFATQSFSYWQDWEWGFPTYGPSSVPTGNNCWGTKLTTTYHDSSQSRIYSPSVTIPSNGKNYLVLYHWMRAQAIASSSPFYMHDGGNVKILTSANDTVVIFPQKDYDGYASRYNLFVAYQSAFGDTFMDYWHIDAFDLTPWAGQSVRFFFDFGSSSQNREAGWYIAFAGIANSAATSVEENTASLKPSRLSLKVTPNPFNDECIIYVENPGDDVGIDIYDLSGKRLANYTLSGAANSIRWKPNSESGIFFVRAISGKNSVVQKVMFIK